jgi:hypothetical protein
MFFDTAGHVGIGTSTPAYTLDVNGTGNFAGAVNFGTPVTFASGQTFPIPAGGVTNAMLQNPSLTVTAGSGLSGGGSVSLGGSTTLSLSSNISGSTGTFSGSTSPVVSGTNTANGSYGQLGTSVSGNPTGVYGSSGVTGVYGSGGYYGVWGATSAEGGTAVYGTSAAGTLGTGVYATGDTAVWGISTTNGSQGMLGTSVYTSLTAYPTGVYGSSTSSTGSGVDGYESAASGVVYGVSGTVVSTGTNSPYADAWGVYGTNTTYGSYGQLGGRIHYSILGIPISLPTGVYGHGSGYGVYGNGSIGVEGVEASGGSYGVFSDGDMGSSGKKPAVVALPDNRVVELYAMESPELWFEDFGSGQLRDGVGEVAFDPTFALAANMAPGYHVFLTPKGDCEGLYVTNETATGFQVRELRGGKSNIAFDYRIVAKRRGYESVRMDELEADAETVQAMREFVQRPPHRKKLILHKPPEAPKAPPHLPKVAAPPAAPAVAIPKPPEPPKLPAPPALPKLPAPPALAKVGAAVAAPGAVTPKPPEHPKAGAAPEASPVVTPKPPEPAKQPAAPEPPQ